jgi:phage tail-like protein
MDANGTRLHLLLGYENWSACTVQIQDESPTSLRKIEALSPTGVSGTYTLREAWEASPPGSLPADLAWDQRDELTLEPRLFQFPPSAKDKAPTLEDRRGAGRDRFGNWYWIAASGTEILVRSAGSHRTSHFWSAGDGIDCARPQTRGMFRNRTPPPAHSLLPLSGLAVTEDHYLVIGVLQPKGLLIFDLYGGSSPQQVCWPAAVPFVPFDMAPAPGGGVWILDRIHARYWALDRQMQVIRTDQAQTVLSPEQARLFQPVGGGTPRRLWAKTFPEGIALSASSPVAALNAVAIEALPDGTVLILDRSPNAAFSDIYGYRLGQLVGQPVSTNAMLRLIEEQSKPGFHLLGHDFAFVPEHQEDKATVPDRLIIAAAEGNQAYAFTIAKNENGQLTLEPLPEYLPMRLFGGKALVTAGSQAYYDFGDGWIPLTAQRRPRYSERAVFETPLNVNPPSRFDTYPPARPAFDGREPNCVWHRLLLDACIPPETSVTVWSRAANEQRDLPAAAWQREPSPYLRSDGSELPFLRKPPAAPGRGTWELLFQRARGRYLQLRIQLTGNGRSTPRLRALRAYYPRFSYLDHYLPAVYREDQPSASFLDRFLANLEGFDTAIEDKIAAVQLLFDVRSAPPETLDWLASWFGIALDPAWGETEHRLFLRHAMDFFQYRGTLRGLQMALRLVLDQCPNESIFSDPFGKPNRPHPIRIIEKFRTRHTPSVVLGDPTGPVGLRLPSAAKRWFPADGSAALHERYTDFLYPPVGGSRHALELFPLIAPAGQAAAWQQFAQATLGFIPSAGPADLDRWQEFLARRYQRIRALNTVYGTDWLAFEEVPLPTQLPAGRALLLDWYQFESVVLAMRRTASRFTILLPAPTEDTPDHAEHRRRLDLATRVINLEKPAHTVFDVKFYWAYFRVGSVRLGEDTILDRGSRDPRLSPPMILGQGFLSESFLTASYPQNVSGRQVIGRDAPGQVLLPGKEGGP